MLLDYISAALVTMLVTLDPPALAPIFVSLTRGMNAAERRRVAVRASLIAFGILAFFGLGGELLLRLLGDGIPAFRISGGLLLFWIAFEMVFERRNERKQHTADIAITEDHIRNVAAFPLAIPLMAGPGAITAVILLAGRADLCALGRPHLYDPQWTLHAAAEQEYSGPGVTWPQPYAAGNRRPQTGRNEGPRPRLELVRRGEPRTRHARWRP